MPTLAPVTSLSPLTRSDVPPMLATYGLVHDAMARDAERLVRTIERLEGPAHARRLWRWFKRFAREIQHHHAREDEIVFPELRRRAPAFALDAEVLDADHQALDEAMGAVSEALRRLTRGTATSEAMAATTRFTDALVVHLRREEEAAFGRIAEHFSAEEYAEREQQMLKATPLSVLAFEAPFVLERVDAATRAERLAAVPVPLRVLYRIAFAPEYRRLDRALVRP